MLEPFDFGCKIDDETDRASYKWIAFQSLLARTSDGFLLRISLGSVKIWREEEWPKQRSIHWCYDGRPAIGNVHRSEGSCPFLEEIPVLSTTMTTLHSKTRHYLPPLRHTSASRVRHPRHCTVLKNLAAPPPRRPAAPFDDESGVLNLVPVFPRCRHV